MSEREPGLADYLNRSDDQRRLLGLMADGHGRAKHGRELGEPNAAAYRTRVGRHLRRAPIGLEVLDPNGDPRYLIADARTNQVAWITPHREQRSTFFQPRAGVHTYLRSVATRSTGASPLDLAAIRGPSRDPMQATVRRITSAARAVQRSTAARVP